MMDKLRIFLAVIFILIFTFFSSAQKGSLAGFVKDAASGEPLYGVTVKLEGANLGAITDDQGFYEIKNIPPNVYSVKASFFEYEDQIVYNTVIKSSGNADVNFQLQPTESIELEGVSIVASPFKKSKETPLSTNKLSAEEIATYPGGNNDVAKVVQSLPGIGASVGGFRNDIIIRGGAPNENVYYLDGIEIPNINHFSTQGSAGGPVGLLNVSFFEGVTLSATSFGAQYDNTLSGVLQFDQRIGNNREMQRNIRVSSSETALTLEGPLFKGDRKIAKTSYIISARRSYLQLLFKAIGLPILPDYWDYQYKINHKINEYNDLILLGVGAIDNFSVNLPEDFTVDELNAIEQVPIIDQYSSTSGVTWRKRFKDVNGFMTTSASINLLRNDFKRFQDNRNLTGLLLNNLSQEQEAKLRYYYKRYYEKFELSAGFVVQNADYRNETEDIVNQLAYENNLNFWRYGAFVQANTSILGDKLSISGGLRVDGNDYTTTGNEIYRTISPRVALSYALDAKKKWSLNASVGRYFKIPPYTILGFQDNNGVNLNQDAEYIQSDHYVMGLEYLPTKSSKLSVEGFLKEYANYPVSVNDSVSLANLGGDFSVLGNENIMSVGLGRTYGVEFLAQQKLSKNFYGILAVTIFQSEFTGFDPNEFRPSAWNQTLLTTFTGGYKFGAKKNWELSLRVRLAGRTPYAPVDEDATLQNYPVIIKDFDRLGDVELDRFNQTDIRLDKKWSFDKWALDIFFEVQNVFAQALPGEPSYTLAKNEDGSIIFPQQLVQLPNVDTGSILPSIGIVIDF
jgi:hypothetical protein